MTGDFFIGIVCFGKSFGKKQSAVHMWVNALLVTSIMWMQFAHCIKLNSTMKINTQIKIVKINNAQHKTRMDKNDCG